MSNSFCSAFPSANDVCNNWAKCNIGSTVKVLGGGIATLSAAYYVTAKIRYYQESAKIEKAIKERRSKRENDFQALRQKYKLTPDAKSIVDIPVEELIRKLQERSLTATQVYQAYMAKALSATTNFNCITEFVPYAGKLAEELDKLPEVKGPLHGVPICLKDDHDIQGMDTTLGLGKNLNKPAGKNAAIVQIFIDQGAIPFCKTNVPQSLVSYGSDNPIYGQTVNHINATRSPGGSSSGTGCLIGAGGAPFGTGSDFGGSVRIPAHFNGICSIRPTVNRLSGNGVVQLLPKCVGCTGVSGIMAKEAQAVATAFRAITLDGIQNKYDPQAMPIPWDDKSKKPLRIGYYTSLSFFPALGDTSETVLKAKEALESLGHTLVPFTVKDNWERIKLVNDLVCVDFGPESYLANHVFANEPSAKALEGLTSVCGLPVWRRRLLHLMTKIPLPSMYSKRASVFALGGLEHSTSRDVWEMMHQKNEATKSILSDMADLDLLLTPAFPFAASGLNDSGILMAAVVYTMIWNLVDFPAGIVTYGKETGKNLDNYDDEGDSVLRHAKNGAKESIGCPIAVQIVGKPFKEEMVLRAMVELRSTYKK